MILPEFPNNPLRVHLSFHKLVSRLEEIAASNDSFFNDYARSLLVKIAKHPELTEGITSIDQLHANEDLINEMLIELFPRSLTNNEIKGVSIPYQGFVFNLTERFKAILKAAGSSFEINIRNFEPHQFYVFSCCIVLNKFYGTDLDFAKPLFYDIPTAEGYIKHYRIFYNIDFLEIAPAKNAVMLSKEDIVLLMNNYDDLSLWMEKFPPGSWIVKGFSIMTLFDVTVENAVSILKTNLIESVVTPDLKDALTSIFRSIYRLPQLQIGFTEFRQEKGILSHMPLNKSVKSFLLGNLKEEDMEDVLCDSSYNKLMLEHTYFSVSDVDAFLVTNPSNKVVKQFQAQHMQSFILAPVVKNDKLLGVIELASPHVGQLNSVNANKLEIVMPYITDTIERRSNEMRDRIRAVIQTNYTSLHPSVYWRFQLEAQNYIEAAYAGIDYELEEIVFKDVYPLYGQVDIKDSSETRNLSIRTDLQFQLGELFDLLVRLNGSRPQLIPTAIIASVKKLIDGLSTEFNADTEHSINHNIALNVYPLLRDESAFNEKDGLQIKEYFEQVNASESRFNINWLNYEKTIAMTNESLVTILDKRQAEAQNIACHYYERFKTDGVEHNLYVGDSLLQDGKLNLVDLKKLRLWELMVIAEMQIAHHHLKPELPYHLGVTSLILAFNIPIAIRFRMDEKHFDVDGAYNVRYEVIKKRVDKAHIKNSGERITRHGKIVIIYSDEEQEQEYSEYIRILQDAGILDSHVEHFDVEELQGVSGLKAIRIGTLYDQKTQLDAMSYNSIYQQLS